MKSFQVKQKTFVIMIKGLSSCLVCLQDTGYSTKDATYVKKQPLMSLKFGEPHFKGFFYLGISQCFSLGRAFIKY